MSKSPLQVYLSYALSDERFGQELYQHLEPLVRGGVLRILRRQSIVPGTQLLSAVERFLDAADIIIILQSPDYLTTPECFSEEMERAIEKYYIGSIKIIPVVLRDCALPQHLASLQALPRKGGPIKYRKNRDAAWTEIVRAIQQFASSEPEPTKLASLRKPQSADLHQLPKTTQAQPINPFTKRQPLAANDITYIDRECDKDLMTALEETTLIAIQGSFRIGKTSLLNKTRFCLTGKYNVIRMDLEDFRIDSDKIFYEMFFEQVSEQLKCPIYHWLHYRAAAQQFKITMMIDEFGRLARADFGGEFISALVHFAEESRVPIIVSLPVSIDNYFQVSGIKNSRYTDNWHQISIPPFSRKEILQLSSLLSLRARGIVEQNIEVVLEHSTGIPASVQTIFFELFRSECRGESENDLLSILQSKGRYK